MRGTYILLGSIRWTLSTSLFLLLAVSSAQAEFSGYVGAQLRWFYETPVDSKQKDLPFAVNAEPEWYVDWNAQRDSFIFKPYLRLDSVDSERNHFDIRELYWLHVFDQWELGLGVSKVYWGVTESQHLVDIVNQTDLVEAPDGEEKLGQPMIRLSTIRNWGALDVFVLPGFRVRNFPGEEGRLRASLPIDHSSEKYESSAKENHVDVAARWNQSFGQWDIGLSGFVGTSRDPLFSPITKNGVAILQAFYPQIKQLGVDAQVIMGSWLWKLEAIHRSSDYFSYEEYTALTGGFEYTWVGIFEQIWDLGLLLEYNYDDRSGPLVGALQDDVFMGGRFAFNDIASSEILFGVIQDMEYGNSRSALIEANTRLNDNLKIYIEARVFESKKVEDPVFQIRQDSYIELAVEYYF